MAKLRRFPPPWHPQLALIRRWYEPHLERLYDHARLRAGDLDQLEQIAAQHSTRARNSLYLVQPLRMFVRQQPRHGDRYLFAPRSRFIPDSIIGCFERRSQGHPSPADQPTGSAERVIDLPARVLSQWS